MQLCSNKNGIILRFHYEITLKKKKKRYHEFLGTVSADCLWETLGRNVYFWFYLQYELES